MGIALIKKINEKTPYWIKKPFAKIIRNKLIKNSIFIDTYGLLKKGDSMSAEERNYWQFLELKRQLEHAVEHSKYYRELFAKENICVKNITSLADIKAIPVLENRVLKERLEDIVADDCEDFYVVTTGGTSGKPTKVFMEKSAIYKEWAFVYHYWAKFGYDYHTSKLATFRGVDLGKKLFEINPLYQEIRLNPFRMNGDNIQVYEKLIKKYEADFLYGYPSAVYNYCRLCEEKAIDLKGNYKAVFLISENLYPFQRKLIERVTNCRIAMFYGHSERSVFAEKYKQGYIFNSFYGITEVNEKGEPVVTGFINRKTPLIRYVVDDEVRHIKNEYYSLIGHHNEDVLYGKNGEQFSIAALNVHDDTFEITTGYQLVQKEVGLFEIHVTSNKHLSNTELNSISNRVQKKIGSGFTCSTVQVEKLELTARGKLKLLVQNVKK